MFWVIFGIIILVITFGPIVLYGVLHIPYTIGQGIDFLSNIQIRFPENSLSAIIVGILLVVALFATTICFFGGFFIIPLELKKRREYNEKVRPLYTAEGVECLKRQGTWVRTCFFALSFIIWFVLTHSV